MFNYSDLIGGKNIILHYFNFIKYANDFLLSYCKSHSRMIDVRENQIMSVLYAIQFSEFEIKMHHDFKYLMQT